MNTEIRNLRSSAYKNETKNKICAQSVSAHPMKTRLALAQRGGALLILLLCVVGAQSAVPGDQSHKAQQPSQADQPRIEKAPIAVKIVELPKDEQKERSDWWLVVLTGVLAFMALVQTLVFAYQGYQLKQTVKMTRANTEALVNAERAYLSFEGFKVIDVRNLGLGVASGTSPYTVSVDLKNYGRTPATVTVFWMTPIVLDTFTCHELVDPDGTVVIAQPIAPSAIDSKKHPITLDDWSDIVARKKSLVMYGKAAYQDIFGKSHTSGFACLYVPPTNGEDQRFAPVCLDTHWYST